MKLIIGSHKNKIQGGKTTLHNLFDRYLDTATSDAQHKREI